MSRGSGKRGDTMRGDLIELVAFAIQDATMTRLQARRYAKAALSALQPGDLLDHDRMVVSRRSERHESAAPQIIRGSHSSASAIASAACNDQA